MRNLENRVLITCIFCALVTSLAIGFRKTKEPKTVARPMSFGTVIERVDTDSRGAQRILFLIDTDEDMSTFEKMIILKKDSEFADKIQQGAQVQFKDYGGKQLLLGDIYKIGDLIVNRNVR